MSHLELRGDFMIIAEAASDGTYPIKVIQEGWGTSGYYGKDVLMRDAPKAFPAGTHMHWNHGTAQELRARRGQRDMRDLAAVLLESASWSDSGFDGPGVYSRFKPFPQYAESIKSMGPYVGVSIYAGGVGVEGEAAGRKGTIITGLDEDVSGLHAVDFVPRAGAGGKYLTLFESALGGSISEQAREEAAKASLQESVRQRYLRDGHSEEEAERMSEIFVDPDRFRGEFTFGGLRTLRREDLS